MKKIAPLSYQYKKAPWIFLGLLLLGFLIFPRYSLAQVVQESDSVNETKEASFSSLPKNPRKATILSAILPGAGQVYNGKSWKVPIIYAGFMTDIYFIQFNNRRYQVFREALFASDNNEPSIFPNLNRQALARNVDYWRRNRDLTILLLAVIYGLNLIDANVDAHLSGFDISDDLALAIEPHHETIMAQTQQVGLSIKLKF